ncbi:TLC domain-containing protein 4-B [Linum grandiflorum]
MLYFVSSLSPQSDYVKVLILMMQQLMVPVPKETVMAIEAYRSQAQVLVKSYLFADPFVPYTSVLGGVVACKVIYDITQLISTFYIKTYSGLTKIQRIEWNNRGMSSLHAIFITALSLYFVFWSDLFSDKSNAGYVTLRSSPLSIFGLAVSVGYFIADLGMIFWFYPSLGGMEYEKKSKPARELTSIAGISYAMVASGFRYLDISGMKRSTAYLVNGVLIFVFWFIARVLLFFYIFYHINMHFDQIVQMMWFGCVVVVLVPSTLFIMNLIWFSKIIKGLLKILAKRQ